MAYTPPSGDAVDFTGSGIIVSAPQGDQVDFITYPATLARSALVVHLVVDGYAFQQRAESALTLIPTVTASSNHQFPSGALVVQPTIIADVTLARIATAALSVRPVVSCVAAAGQSADAAISVVPIPTGIAAYVYKADSTLQVIPVVSGTASIPVITATCALQVKPVCSGVVSFGVIVNAALVVRPVIIARTDKDKFVSADFYVLPSIISTATTNSGAKAMASGKLFVRPTIQAGASV